MVPDSAEREATRAVARRALDRLRRRCAREAADFDVQIVRSNGTGRRTLAGTRAYELDAQWSPDGLLLSVDLGGRVLNRFPATPELEQPAAWSPGS